MKTLTLCAVLTGAAVGQSIPVELKFTESQATIEGINLANGSSDTVDYSFSGSLLADIEMDRESGKLIDFRLSGGRLSISDFDAVGTLLLLPTTVQARSLAGTPGTSEVEETINPETGVLPSGVHFFDVNEGGLIFRISAGDQFFRRDYSDAPLFRPFNDTLTVTSKVLGSNLLGERYEFTFTQDSLIDEDFAVTGNISIHLSGTSTSVAVGEATVISEQAREWADDSDNLDFLTLADTHPVSGVSLALLYAMGKEADDEIDLSISHQTHSCSISLPDGGTRLPLLVEWSKSMLPDSWQTIQPGGEILAGTLGTVQIVLPESQALFVRLRSEVP